MSQVEPAEGSDFHDLLPPDWTVLKSIKIDPSIWQDAMDHAGGHSYNNAMSRGNIDLLMDKSSEARKEFEHACELSDGSSSKNMREAVEGIARAIRAKEGSAEPANAFVLSMRQEPAKVLAIKIDPEKLREVARQLTTIPTRAMDVPELETQRRESNELTKHPSTSIVNVATNFEGASPLRLDRLSPTHLKLILTTQIPMLCDWFLFRVDGANGQTIRIDLTTDLAPLDRWWTLNPVWCDADDYSHPDAPSSKNMLFDSLLQPDTTGQSWHYIAAVWRSDARTLSFVHHFSADRAYVAMRVPYTPSQNERFLKLYAGLSDRAKLITVGKSRQGRPLLMLKIGEKDEEFKPCMLIYGGEHADEPDGMWVARGAIEFLTSDTPEVKQLRDHFTFLVVPQLDPDASARGLHEGINTSFLSEVKTQESIAYANWFQSWINAGNRLDLVFDLHNMQSSEMGHVQCWLMEGLGDRGELSSLVNLSVRQAISASRFEMIATPTQRGWSPDRLGGWLSRRYGPLTFLYEVNSQAPYQHLSLAELKEIGAALSKAVASFLTSSDGAKLLTNVNTRRTERLARWAQHQTAWKDLDAIEAEALVSKGVGISDGGTENATIEKWVP